MGETDLDFLIPSQHRLMDLNTGEIPPYEYSKIPMTIVYVNQKLTAHGVAAQIRTRLPPESHKRPVLGHLPLWHWDGRSLSEKIVAVYHASLSPTMKQYIQEDWRNGITRILVATSAWGMGINDQKVERVIQWRIKDLENLDTLYQRFGRCARDTTLQGVCLLFAEKDYLASKHRQNKLEKGLNRFINCPGAVKCRRKIILGFYADNNYHSPSPPICCDLCGSDQITRLAPGVFNAVFEFSLPTRAASQFPRSTPALRLAVHNALCSLRYNILHRDYKNRLRILTPQHIINNEQVEILARHSRGLTCKETILKIPGFSINPSHFHKHG